jgi:hypothetical protein
VKIDLMKRGRAEFVSFLNRKEKKDEKNGSKKPEYTRRGKDI